MQSEGEYLVREAPDAEEETSMPVIGEATFTLEIEREK